MKYPEVKKISAENETKEKGTRMTNEAEKGTKMTNSAGTENTPAVNSVRTTPKYKIVHRGHFDLQDFTLARYVVYF